MGADSAYRGLGALIAAGAVGWVAERAGMSSFEVTLVAGMLCGSLLMAAGAKFWS